MFMTKPPSTSRNFLRVTKAVLFINIRRHDDIRDSRLIFHGDKNETLRGPWALARDDAAGRAHKHAVAAVAQVF